MPLSLWRMAAVTVLSSPSRVDAMLTAPPESLRKSERVQVLQGIAAHENQVGYGAFRHFTERARSAFCGIALSSIVWSIGAGTIRLRQHPQASEGAEDADQQ